MTRIRAERWPYLWAAMVIVLLVALGIAGWCGASYVTCTVNRTQALTGPGNDRVARIDDAFEASALAGNAHLPPAQRAADLAVLRKDRAKYPAIPADPALGKLPDSTVLVLFDAIEAFQANDEYESQLKSHPVCQLWPPTV